MVVTCNRRCWDSTRNRRYHPGDQDDIDPLEPIAGCFDFPPGTEVYWKKPGTKTTPAESTTRIVGAAIVEQKQIKALEKEAALLEKRLASIKNQKEALTPKVAPVVEPKKEVVAAKEEIVPEIVKEVPVAKAIVTCDVCGKYTGTTAQVRSHRYNCVKRTAKAAAKEAAMKVEQEALQADQVSESEV